MVVQEDDAPVEAAVSKQSKRYVIVKNHVRELMPDIASSGAVAPKQEVDKCIKMKNKNLKKRKQGKEFISSEPAPTDMSRSDIDELRAVYKKCKQILKKVESKYGHLLDLDDEDSISKRKKTETSDEETESDSCNCLQNKKIVFDENGQQIEKVCALENHICPKRIKKRYDDQIKTSKPLEKQLAVQVEYDQCEKIRNELSDSLEELGEILKNPNIDNVYRKMVIDKIYMKRQDHLFEIRNERKFLVEKLKENADELLDFKGSNISTLPGYPKNPTDNDEAVNK